MPTELAVYARLLQTARLIAGVLALAAVPTLGHGATPGPLLQDEEAEGELLQLDLSFTTRRTAGSTPIDLTQAGDLRGRAAVAAKQLRKQQIPSGTSTFGGAWTQLGPNPVVQGLRSPGGQRFGAMSGRIGALAIRPSNGQFILGAAQGGIWLYDAGTGTWSPKTDDQTTQSMGALAIAPSNDAIIYAGTGEGALSGDSYFGNGVFKSTDGGNTWAKVSGDTYFNGVSMSRIVVDPANADHLYAAVLRGRGGARRVSPPDSTKFGVWESKDGGVNWAQIQKVKNNLGATDLEMDPQNPLILYSSFWGDAIYKSVDGGKKWTPVMTGLPIADYAGAQTRFSIAISHPSPGGAGTLYVGFDWIDGAGHHPSRVFKSTDGAASWTLLPAGVPPVDPASPPGQELVEDYCAEQCFYDNVIEVDPTNPDIVYAAGQFNYDIGSGGIFRSDDGGQTWINLGYDQHPDFHAFAFNRSDTKQVLIGNDGGVWFSSNRGGRPTAASLLSEVDWQSLNGTVVPATVDPDNGPFAGTVTHRSNLSITQYTSIATVPQIPVRFWGGTQDNGTLRKSGGSPSWFDMVGGDGGQVLVDHTFDPASDSCPAGFAPACVVYGTFFGISPYRMTDGGAFFFNAFYIRSGIDLTDRSDFYTPFVLNQEDPNQLFLGTYRLYRTDNARTAKPGDVKWKAISGDLTSGCTGTAPNGARNCTISAIGVGGGEAVYTGSLDGLVYVSTDAQVNDNPVWTRVKDDALPKRPVAGFAVDRSNYRIAYAAFNGFNGATPGHPGHVFRTLDGGSTWTDISGNLPDAPVNWVILDPSYSNTLYAATDVGPFVTYNGGTDWSPLGTGFPLVGVWQLDLDSSHRLLAAGTHGRGAYRLADATANAAPALVMSKVDDGKPVGPSSNIVYTLTLKNEGNAAANDVTMTDPVPVNTTFVSADSGGTNVGGKATWSIPTIAPGAAVSVQLTVSIANALNKKVTSIVNDGFQAQTADGFFTTGSPVITPLAPPYAVALNPATQTDGGQVGSLVPYTLTIENNGFNADNYTLSAANAWTTTFFDATCTTPLTTATPSVPSGESLAVCAKVAIPVGAANDTLNTGTVTATSVASSSVSATATLKTIAVAVNVNTLLVDNDNNNPDVQGYYTAALTAAGIAFSKWDLGADSNLPRNFVLAFKNVVWFTGNSYPAPIGPYEGTLQAFLDNGGRLLMSGQDILDQAAGTTAFVHDYLHITWDGTETQNDKATAHVNGVGGSPVSSGIGAVPLDHTVLGAAFEDRITPNGTAAPAFTDDTGATDALSFSGSYKVVFLAFPLEAYGTAADKTGLISRVFTFFGP
jgi:uncharacterized repeat protein (TIGR01451 family)